MNGVSYTEVCGSRFLAQRLHCLKRKLVSKDFITSLPCDLLISNLHFPSALPIRQKHFAFADDVRLMFQMQFVSPIASSRYVKPNT